MELLILKEEHTHTIIVNSLYKLIHNQQDPITKGGRTGKKKNHVSLVVKIRGIEQTKDGVKR